MTTLSSSELKRPDRFMSTVTAFFQTFSKNGRGVFIVLAILLAMGGAVSLWGDRQASKSNDANGALYSARKVYEAEMKSIVDADLAAAPPAVVGKAAEKTKSPQPSEMQKQEREEALRFVKWDVEAKLPKSLAAYKGVIDRFSGTRAAFDARLAIADLYQNHGAAPQALAAYEAAQSAASDPLSRALVFSAIGYAHENAGKCDAAIKAWESALNQGEAGMKVDLQMAIARCAERVGNAAQARTAYEKIMTDEPGTEAARTAELYKSQLVKP